MFIIIIIYVGKIYVRACVVCVCICVRGVRGEVLIDVLNEHGYLSSKPDDVLKKL